MYGEWVGGGVTPGSNESGLGAATTGRAPGYLVLAGGKVAKGASTKKSGALPCIVAISLSRLR